MTKQNVYLYYKDKHGNWVGTLEINGILMCSTTAMEGMYNAMKFLQLNSHDFSALKLVKEIRQFFHPSHEQAQTMLVLMKEQLIQLYTKLGEKEAPPYTMEKLFGPTALEATSAGKFLWGFLTPTDHLGWKTGAAEGKVATPGSFNFYADKTAGKAWKALNRVDSSDKPFVSLWTIQQYTARTKRNQPPYTLVSMNLQQVLMELQMLAHLGSKDPSMGSEASRKAAVLAEQKSILRIVLIHLKANPTDKLAFRNNRYSEEEFDTRYRNLEPVQHLEQIIELVKKREAELLELWEYTRSDRTQEDAEDESTEEDDEKEESNHRTRSSRNRSKGRPQINALKTVPPTLIPRNIHYDAGRRNRDVGEAILSGNLMIGPGDETSGGKSLIDVAAELHAIQLESLLSCRSNPNDLTDVLKEMNVFGKDGNQYIAETVNLSQLNVIALAAAASYQRQYGQPNIKEEYFLLTPTGTASTTTCTQKEFVTSIKRKDGNMPSFDHEWMTFTPAMKKAVMYQRTLKKGVEPNARQVRHFQTTMDKAKRTSSASGTRRTNGARDVRDNRGQASRQRYRAATNKDWFEDNKDLILTNKCVSHYRNRGGCKKGDSCQYLHGDLNNLSGQLSRQQMEDLRNRLDQNLRTMR